MGRSARVAHCRCRRHSCVHRRRGLSSIYVAVFIVAIFGFASLAVDIGRIRLARTELQVATDAAARAGADSLPITIAATINNTVETADRNTVIDAERNKPTPDGERTNPGVELVVDEDIEIGTWDANADPPFTAIPDTGKILNDPRRRGNAVRVVGKRIKERNNPIPLILAQVLPDGPVSSDIVREAIAKISGGPSNFGFVGIDKVTAHGNGAAIDSAVYGKAGTGGGVGSDGDIDLGNADVYGDARPGTGKDLLQGPNSEVTGWTAPLDYKLADRYPADAWNPPATNNNASITPTGAIDSNGAFAPQGRRNYNFPANGKYLFKGWTANNGTTTINAPADIYIDGDFTMSGSGTLKIHTTSGTTTQVVRFIVNGNFKQSGGNIVNDGASASSFYIAVTKAGTTVDLKGNPDMKAHINAPLSAVTCNGTSSFTGWIVGKTLDFFGTCNLHYDETRSDGRHYTITLVK